MGKLNIIDLLPNIMLLLGTGDTGMGRILNYRFLILCLGKRRMIYNGTTLEGEGCLLLPDPPRVPLYIVFHPEAGYTFAPFRSLINSQMHTSMGICLVYRTYSYFFTLTPPCLYVSNCDKFSNPHILLKT